MARCLFGIARDKRAAAAPTIALALFGLIGSAGLAFDYARFAALDTELQQAADQAALAAATQLDRTEGSRQRATDAITADDKERLAENFTRFANDGNADGAAIEIDDIKFCSEFDDAVADTDAACEEVEGEDEEADGQARFVVVTTRVRAAEYALTPIVGAFTNDVAATAVAGVESSICNVAPLLVCAPSDDFPTSDDIGRGIVMKVAPSGSEKWAPGNFGYLDFGNGNPAVLAALLGNGLDGCQSQDDNETEPGNKNATDAINTRMDVYAGQNKNDAANCVPTTGAACPAENTRKDMVMEMTYKIELGETDPAPTAASVPNCGADKTPNNQNPSISYTSDFAQNGSARQFGRDTCHYNGTCPTTGGAQNFGNKIWDINGYLAANHPGITASAVATAVGNGATATTLTRYQIYLWEIANKNAPNNRLDPVQVGTTTADEPDKKGKKITYTFRKVCAFNQPKFAPAADPTVKDRRVLPIVAANCDNLKGKGAAFEDYVILRVFDAFLTEPSLERSASETGIAGATYGTNDKEIYGEVIGPAQPVGGSGGFQYYSRSRPYLVR